METRRRFLTKTLYLAPVILTVPVHPAFAGTTYDVDAPKDEGMDMAMEDMDTDTGTDNGTPDGGGSTNNGTIGSPLDRLRGLAPRNWNGKLFR